MNQRESSEKKAVRGIAPLEPVCLSRTLSRLSVASVMPGKYAAQRHATPDHPSYERCGRGHRTYLPLPAVLHSCHRCASDLCSARQSGGSPYS